MKTITRFLGLATIVAMFILLDACKAEKGDIGPAGTAGPTGANGNVGATGSAGATGATGTANVIYGNWIDMNVVGYWYKLANDNGGSNNGGGTINTFNGRGWGSDFAAPITQDILDKGQVFVYGKWQSSYSDKRVYLLPNSFWGLYYTQVNFLLNRIYIQTIWDQSLTVPSTYSPNSFLNQFRYIIVAGSVNGRKAAVDYTDYEAVKKYYNLKD